MESPRENDLKRIRIDLGLTITELSRLAKVSTKVISQTERMIINPTQVTKSKIVHGLNGGLPPGEEKLHYKKVFPNEEL